jgi:hypothetical protein
MSASTLFIANIESNQAQYNCVNTDKNTSIGAKFCKLLTSPLDSASKNGLVHVLSM